MAKDCTFCDRRKKKGLGPCGHHGGAGSRKKANGWGSPSKPAPKATRPIVASEKGFSGKALAAHLRQLHADVERGEAAKEELADIKKAIAGL